MNFNLKLIRLLNIEKEYNLNNKIYALYGGDNITGSIKDITVYGMLKSYKDANVLKDNTTIIEATSGNTGISLAYFQKEFNYNALIVMPSSMSEERRNKITSYGAALYLVDGGMEECEEMAIKLSKTIDNSFVFSQFDSSYNPNSHYNITGPFIINNLKEVDILVAGIGTGGTITGTSKFLKENIKDFYTIGVEPYESPLLTKNISNSHLIQGIGANFIPSILDLKYIDKIIDIKGIDSIEMAKHIYNTEHIYCGYSSGAALLGVIEYIKQNNITNKNIVVIFPDKGDRYTW